MADYTYPYTDFHRLNLDWLIEYVQNLVAGTITQDDVLQALGDAPDKLISQKAITDILNARRAEVEQLLAGKFDKADIVQTSGTSETKVMSQEAVRNAIAAVVDDIAKTTFTIAKDDAGHWVTSRTYSEVIGSLSKINWKYYFYPGRISDGGYCEIFPAANTGASLMFTGIVDYQTSFAGRINILHPVSILWLKSGLITVVNNGIGVDDYQDTNKLSTSIAPSSRYVHENFVEYNDIETGTLSLDPHKVPSSAELLQNYDMGIHTGAFSPVYDVATKSIRLSGGNLRTADTMSLTINTVLDSTASGNIKLKITISAVVNIETTIRIFNGFNRITVRRSVANVNGWEIVNCSEQGLEGQYISTTTIPTASGASYNNWVIGFTPAVSNTATITPSNGYSY